MRRDFLLAKIAAPVNRPPARPLRLLPPYHPPSNPAPAGIATQCISPDVPPARSRLCNNGWCPRLLPVNAPFRCRRQSATGGRARSAKPLWNRRFACVGDQIRSSARRLAHTKWRNFFLHIWVAVNSLQSGIRVATKTNLAAGSPRRGGMEGEEALRQTYRQAVIGMKGFTAKPRF